MPVLYGGYTKKEILSRVDHTLLRQDAVWPQIRRVVGEGVENGTASVCIPPSFVRRASEYAGGNVKICTVVGFPNGYNTKSVKVFETEDAIRNGADEIDMVIDIGALRAGDDDALLDEIRAVRAVCSGKILKVIIETCLLTEDEKVRMCGIVSDSGADYIKTSTGFAGGGATFEDIALFLRHVRGIKIKAAGGIRSIEDAARFIELGADRLGTSSMIRLFEEAKA